MTINAPVVFLGPSLSSDDARALAPHARFEPPAARGDLERLLAAGARTFLIVDGAFAQRLAVSPSEIVDAIAAGARVAGASSLGAIRAAECGPAGMTGSGAIYRWYSLGVLRDDDEVAVATDPDRGFAAVSTALVNVRYAVLAAIRRRLVDRAGAVRLLAAAQALHFTERRWPAIFDAARIEPADELRRLCVATDIKRADAAWAVASIAGGLPPAGRPLASRPERERSPVHRSATTARYRGHDRLFGRSEDELRRELPGWLARNGRLHRYIAAAGGPEHGAEAPSPEVVWSELVRVGALERELMHWYADTRV